MILYLDTSSLLKLHLEETGSAAVESATKDARQVTTSLIAYAEARAALARARRLRSVPGATYRSILFGFEQHWRSLKVVDVTVGIVRMAGRLAERHDLRGYDSVHLASALFVQREARTRTAFSTFDDALMAAALKEGLHSTG